MAGNKTSKELFDELDQGKRKTISAPELEAAWAYEDSLFPPNARFPKKGDIYVLLNEIEIPFVVSFGARQLADKAVLPKGMQICVDTMSDEKPRAVGCRPVEYTIFEELIVPKEQRIHPEYSGYYLFVATLSLMKDFVLIG